jgi:hypothetical protein
MSSDSAPGTTRVNSSTALKTTLVLGGVAVAFIFYVTILGTTQLAGLPPLPGWAHGSIIGAFILVGMAAERSAGRAEWRAETAAMEDRHQAELAEIVDRYQKLVSDVIEQRRADAQALLHNQRAILDCERRNGEAIGLMDRRTAAALSQFEARLPELIGSLLGDGLASVYRKGMVAGARGDKPTTETAALTVINGGRPQD